MNDMHTRWGWGRLLTGAVVLCFSLIFNVTAQEQFFTQSGGRGLQNAKTNARLSKTEEDVAKIDEKVATIKAHAFAELGTCPDEGEKLRWDGSNWICETETDPTVMPFAKKPLPGCAAGAILSVQNGEFNCQTVSFVTAEVDPTVQGWAKNPLPNCLSGEILAVGADKMLTCSRDDSGVTNETDPNVHNFARSDVSAVPNCSATENLTMLNGNLACKTDMAGVAAEVDPLVQNFARTDTGAVLSACGTGELVKATGTSGSVVLECVSASTGLSEALALNDLSDVSVVSATTGQILKFDGTEWVAGADAGGADDPIQLADLGDVDVAGVGDGNLLAYSSTTSEWVDLTLPTCAAGTVLRSDGTGFSCVNDAGGSTDPLDLVELGDVRTNSSTLLDPDDNDFLRWNETSSKWIAVHDKLSSVSMTASAWCYYNGTDVICDRGAPQQCSAGDVISWNATSNGFGCVSASAALGLGTMSLQDADDVSITGGVINGTVIGGTNPAAASFTNVNATNLLATGLIRGASLLVSNGLIQGDLNITGNLNVSGSQTFDGVTFANGGIQVSGTVSSGRLDVANVSVTQNVSVTGNLSAANFYGNGSGLTGVVASNVSWSSIDQIPAQVVQVSNSGAIVMAGISSTNISVTNNLTATSGWYSGDVWVGGNLFVSGSQTFDGVTFANGGIQVSGTVSSGRLDVANVSVTENATVLGVLDAARMLTVGVSSTNVSVTNNLSVAGTGTFGSIGVGNLAATNVSVTNNQTVAGNLRVYGNLEVSGSQTIDGVTFANGGIQVSGTVSSGHIDVASVSVTQNVSVTGNVSANRFIGDGSLITGLNGAIVSASGIAGSIQYKGANGELSGSSLFLVEAAERNVEVSGTVQLSGSGAESCAVGAYGKMRFIDVGAGIYRMQMCRP